MADPRWWHDEHDEAWSRVQHARARDPAETLERDVDAYRYGVGARRHYGIAYPEWDERIEAKMRDEWHALNAGRSWDEVKAAVRRGWDHGTN